eukprot:scaffold1970_cov396-Prasinococcus_capsulatus_cf.AAC.6
MAGRGIEALQGKYKMTDGKGSNAILSRWRASLCTAHNTKPAPTPRAATVMGDKVCATVAAPLLQREHRQDPASRWAECSSRSCSHVLPLLQSGRFFSFASGETTPSPRCLHPSSWNGA